MRSADVIPHSDYLLCHCGCASEEDEAEASRGQRQRGGIKKRTERGRVGGIEARDEEEEESRVTFLFSANHLHWGDVCSYLTQKKRKTFSTSMGGEDTKIP